MRQPVYRDHRPTNYRWDASRSTAINLSVQARPDQRHRLHRVFSSIRLFDNPCKPILKIVGTTRGDNIDSTTQVLTILRVIMMSGRNCSMRQSWFRENAVTGQWCLHHPSCRCFAWLGTTNIWVRAPVTPTANWAACYNFDLPVFAQGILWWVQTWFQIRHHRTPTTISGGTPGMTMFRKIVPPIVTVTLGLTIRKPEREATTCSYQGSSARKRNLECRSVFCGLPLSWKTSPWQQHPVPATCLHQGWFP